MNLEKKQDTNLLKKILYMPKGIYNNMTESEKQLIGNIIENLKNKIKFKLEKKEELSFTKKYFLYNFSNRIGKNELVKEYSEFFEDFSFLELYSKYRTEIESNHKVYVDTNGLDQVHLNNHFANLDLNDLEYFFNEWKNEVITNDNLYRDPKTNKNKLINILKTEAKNQIDEYKIDLKDKNQTLDTGYNLNSEYTMFVLHSKFIYLLCNKTKETFNINNSYNKLILNNSEVRFTEMSLVHILIRHYSPISKISNKNIMKSNHIEDFPEEKIHLQLENIFNEIDNSKILKNIDLFKNLEYDRKKLDFKFKGLKYRVWFYLNPNKNEKGNVVFKEIDTFYPLTKQTDIGKLSKKIKKINNDLFIYIENE